MHFICVKENLEKALILAERFTGKNVTLPILSNVLFEAEKNSIIITATNLEYGIQVSIPGKVDKEGKISLPAKIISQLVQSIKEEKLDFEEKQGNVFIKTLGRNIRMNGMNANDFPLLPKIKKNFSFSTEGPLLKSSLEKTMPAVSPSEFKPELSGILFKISGSKLHLVATDTFRLAEIKLDLVQKPDGHPLSFILPFRTAQELARVIGEVGEDIWISVGEGQALIEIGRAKIVTRLVDGTFPEYSAIIPKNFETTVYLEREGLLEAIRSSALFASRLQDVVFRLRKKNLEIYTINPEVGEYRTEITAVSSGKECEVSFNYRYLLDGLGALEDKEIFMGLNGSNLPTVLQNKSDSSFIYVVMPIRTS